MADEQITSNTANIPYINLIDVGSDQTTPSAGRIILYIKSGELYVRASDGTVTPVGGAVALAQGQLGVGDGSDQLSALALGTPGDVVTADASGYASWATPAASVDQAPSSLTIWPWMYSAYSGTAPARQLTVSQVMGFYYGAVTQAQNDSQDYPISLSAGTYRLDLLGIQSTDLAIITVKLDGSSVGTIDTYGTPLDWSHLFSLTGIVVATSGLHTLTLTNPTKNASSTDYRICWTALSLTKTA